MSIQKSFTVRHFPKYPLALFQLIEDSFHRRVIECVNLYELHVDQISYLHTCAHSYYMGSLFVIGFQRKDEHEVQAFLRRFNRRFSS